MVSKYSYIIVIDTHFYAHNLFPKHYFIISSLSCSGESVLLRCVLSAIITVYQIYDVPLISHDKYRSHNRGEIALKARIVRSINLDSHLLGHGSWISPYGSWISPYGSWISPYGSWISPYGSWIPRVFVSHSFLSVNIFYDKKLSTVKII